MNELSTYENHFTESIEEINQGEFNILSNLTNELANQFINKILSIFNTNYHMSLSSDILCTPSILDIVKYLDYDNENNSLLINALKKSLAVLNSYNIGAYYLAYYRYHQEEHQIRYNEESNYHILDNNNLERSIGFDVFSLSQIRFKTTKSNFINVSNYLRNRHQYDEKYQLKKVNNQFI